MTTTTSTITVNIIKETEKAVMFSAMVRWSANGKPSEKSFWAPKSVFTIIDETHAAIADWFLNKKSEENAFKGYSMKWEDLYGIC